MSKYYLGARAAADFQAMRAAHNAERVDKRPMRKRAAMAAASSSKIKCATYDGKKYQPDGTECTDTDYQGWVYTGHLSDDTPVQWMTWNDLTGDYPLYRKDSEVVITKAPSEALDWDEWLDVSTHGSRYMAFPSFKRFHRAIAASATRYDADGNSVSAGDSGRLYKGRLRDDAVGTQFYNSNVQYQIYGDAGIDSLVTANQPLLLMPIDEWDTTGWVDDWGMKFYAINIGPYGAWL